MIECSDEIYRFFAKNVRIMLRIVGTCKIRAAHSKWQKYWDQNICETHY